MSFFTAHLFHVMYRRTIRKKQNHTSTERNKFSYFNSVAPSCFSCGHRRATVGSSFRKLCLLRAKPPYLSSAPPNTPRNIFCPSVRGREASSRTLRRHTIESKAISLLVLHLPVTKRGETLWNKFILRLAATISLRQAWIRNKTFLVAKTCSFPDVYLSEPCIKRSLFVVKILRSKWNGRSY